jgi:CheY-like chemotaxis protein
MSNSMHEFAFLAAMTAVGDPAGSPEPESAGDDSRLSLRGRHILVVEDESLIALLIADALEEVGASVVGPCYTLEECLRAAREEQIDAAVLDVDLAGKDVFPAADELRSRGIPFVFHTAHAYRDELHARFGEVPVCRKPVMMEELTACVARIADQRPIN